jgi:predicted O-methyltransferase YrrM
MYFADCDQRLREFVRLDPWEASYLIVAAVRARKAIVEIGRRWGGSTLVLADANRNVPIYSIDIAPRDDRHLRLLLDEHEVGANVRLLVGDSQHGEFAELEPASFDLLFVDGDHSYDGCLADLEHWWPGLATGGSALLHDCYQGSEVQDAAETFFEHRAARFLRPPNVPAAHWLTAEGSLAHAVKI